MACPVTIIQSHGTALPTVLSTNLPVWYTSSIPFPLDHSKKLFTLKVFPRIYMARDLLTCTQE